MISVTRLKEEIFNMIINIRVYWIIHSIINISVIFGLVHHLSNLALFLIQDLHGCGSQVKIAQKINVLENIMIILLQPNILILILYRQFNTVLDQLKEI
jgi:ABC-type dipeptide/oligopeptide/nickel transport system permease subunit